MDTGERFIEAFENWGADSSPIGIGWVLVGAGLVLLLIAGLSIHHWWKTRHQRPTPVLTFLALARQMQLAKSDQWLLLRIGRQQQLPSPMTLMLSAQTLAHHGQAYAATLSRSRRAKLLQRLDAMAAVLFEGATSVEG